MPAKIQENGKINSQKREKIKSEKFAKIQIQILFCFASLIKFSFPE